MFTFEKVYERDIDFIVMRSFVAYKDFAELFLGCVGWSGGTVIKVEHSLTDNSGESDITVILEYEQNKYALLIENKIDASAMYQQFHRYEERGEKGINNGVYDDYEVFIIAPQNYLDNNAEAQLYPNKISYEKILVFFQKNNCMFESEAISSAIIKETKGYTVCEDPDVTEFWNKLYSYVEQSDYKVKMNKPGGPKGSRSLWTYFDVPLTGTFLVFKSEKGFVDFEFSGKRSEGIRIKSDVNMYKDDDMHWADTGNSISLRLVVNSVDFTKQFEEYIDEINTMLKAIERLTDLAVKLNDLGYIV